MSVKWTNTKEALTTLGSKLKCFICGKLPDDPQLLWCKHSFCSSCIEDKPRCPRCQFPISPQEMMPDIMLNKLLQAMRVAAQVSSSCEEQNHDDKENPVLGHKTKMFDKTIVKNNDADEKIINSVKSMRKRSSEMKDVRAVDNEKNPVKPDESKTKVLRKSSRSSSRDDPPREKKQFPEPLRRSSRSRSRDDSSQERKPDFPEPFRRSSRGCSPQKVKTESLEKKDLKAKSKNVSPKATKKNIVMSTPKPKSTSKSSTPILFSAKKVHHTNKVNSKGETPLQIACRQGKLSLVQQLLREGAEPNVKDYANWTPLCDAVGSGSVDVVRALLGAGAAVNTPANLNTTALVEAVVRRNRPMVELLLAHGADMHQRTALGNTPLSLADNEMRAFMLSCGHVSAPPPPHIPTPPRAVLVDAKLPPPQLDQVMELCQRFNLTLSTEFSEEITHVVVEKSASNTCEASTAVMLAIVSGCCVVGMDWVASCVKAEQLVAVDDFEPCGTTDFPTSDVFHKARLNKEQLLPRLLDGCHISLQHDQPWPRPLKADTVSLVTVAGAVYQPRQCDPERVPQGEATVMYHTAPAGPLGAVSHVILYQAGASEPLLKYNMAHVKSLSLTWFHKCIQTFSVTLD